jgi:hypothetical protein
MIRDVLNKIARLLAYLPLNSIKLCLKIINYLRSDSKRLIVFFTFVGIVTLSRLLVNRAMQVRI